MDFKVVLGFLIVFIIFLGGVFFVFNTGDNSGGGVVKTGGQGYTSAPTNSPVSTTTSTLLASSATPTTTPLPRPVETLPVETKPPETMPPVEEYVDVTKYNNIEIEDGQKVYIKGEQGILIGNIKKILK
ncbi:hypothetical protein BMS3Abin16_00346 [archaeon BMS3Abin16]|nr:hypothetical protein BMS3Abin16_00346 [archaeon BMS3Abin16]HDY73901.1 hypothetical protein [Euryarchaeota archaeon]